MPLRSWYAVFLFMAISLCLNHGGFEYNGPALVTGSLGIFVMGMAPESKSKEKYNAA